MRHILTDYRSFSSVCRKIWLVVFVVASIVFDNIDPAAGAEFIPLGFLPGHDESLAGGVSHK
jgi:hypothetical protein